MLAVLCLQCTVPFLGPLHCLSRFPAARESLAFETAEREGVPAAVLARAQELLPLIHEQAGGTGANQGSSGSHAVDGPALLSNHVPHVHDLNSRRFREEDGRLVASESEQEAAWGGQSTGDVAFSSSIAAQSLTSRYPPASTADGRSSSRASEGKKLEVPDWKGPANARLPLTSVHPRMHFEEVSSLLFEEWVRNNGRVGRGDDNDAEPTDKGQLALRSVQIPAQHLPSAAFSSQSCVYIMCRNDGRHYIGEVRIVKHLTSSFRGFKL